MSQVLPFLYLGDQYATTVLPVARQIDSVVSVGCNPNRRTTSHCITYKVSVKDSVTTDLTPFLNDATAFIHDQIRRKKIVLVHCKGGINRSPAIVLAYLCKYQNFSLDDAMLHIKTTRHSVRFQDHYVAQITHWLARK